VTYKLDFKEIAATADMARVVALLNIQITKRDGTQWRGQCPLCKKSMRGLSISIEKKRWKCFECEKFGDAIELVKLVKGCDPVEAAKLLAEGTVHKSTVQQSPKTVPTAPPAPRGFDPEAYASRLEPAHELLQGLRISPETYQAFKAGYAATGVNRGRLALPVHDREGTVVCYCGRALKDESPKLLFPNGTDPHAHIFNAHQVTAGELYLVRDPLQVFAAYEAGETNTVAFLTEAITAQQLEQLASLMDERKVESVQLY
jgi:DNA primase